MELDDLDDLDSPISIDCIKKKPSEKSIKTWVEKYRPSKLSDIVYQKEIVKSLKNVLDNNDAQLLQNLLLYGPPGTGKTSTIVSLAKQMFGDHYSSRVLELNASDERGIQVVRERIKGFAQTSLSQKNTNIPPIKIVILDECDSMTKDAQSALRRIIEDYSQTTRFCLICNYVSKIIDPIVSRCSAYRFKQLKSELVKEKLTEISNLEGCKISDEAIEKLTQISHGDLRHSITLLQTASLVTDPNQTISEETIDEISGFVSQKEIESFFNICRLKSYEKVVAKVESIINMGYSGIQFLSQLLEWIAKSDECLLNDQQKSAIIETISVCDKRLMDGAHEYLQMIYVGSSIIKALS